MRLRLENEDATMNELAEMLTEELGSEKELLKVMLIIYLLNRTAETL